MALADLDVPKLPTRLARVMQWLRLLLGGQPEAVQVAALPWRRAPDGRLEVLLATSRGSGRWVLPKGWPHKKTTLSGSALQEAWEETGVRGTVAAVAIGSYRYDKALDNGLARRVRVHVFPLQVSQQHDAWPEAGERTIRWFDPAVAAGLVQEPELAALLRNTAVLDRLA